MRKINLEEIQDYYFIDKEGKVYSNYRNLKELAFCYDKDGYKKVSLQTKEGKRKSFRINRLVALTYINNPNNYPVVNHINNIKDDNRVENLEWCSVSYNTSQGYKNNNYHFKKKIKSINLLTKEELIFNSIKECASFYNIGYFDISKIANKIILPRKKGKIANLNFEFIEDDC